jgi:diacylglycerol kinase (ATP)
MYSMVIGPYLPFVPRQATLEPMSVGISRIKMSDYEQHHYDKEIMKQSASALGSIEVSPTSDLEAIRVLINKLCDEGPDSPKLSPDWCFIDCKHGNWLHVQVI